MKAEFLRLALAFGGVSVTPTQAQIVIDTVNEIERKGKKFSLEDLEAIEKKYADTEMAVLHPKQIVEEKLSVQEVTEIVVKKAQDDETHSPRPLTNPTKTWKTHQKDGEEYMRLKKYPQAVVSFGRALELHPAKQGPHDNASVTAQKKLTYQVAVAKSMVNETDEDAKRPMTYSTEETTLPEAVGVNHGSDTLARKKKAKGVQPVEKIVDKKVETVIPVEVQKVAIHGIYDGTTEEFLKESGLEVIPPRSPEVAIHNEENPDQHTEIAEMSLEEAKEKYDEGDDEKSAEIESELWT